MNSCFNTCSYPALEFKFVTLKHCTAPSGRVSYSFLCFHRTFINSSLYNTLYYNSFKAPILCLGAFHTHPLLPPPHTFNWNFAENSNYSLSHFPNTLEALLNRSMFLFILYDISVLRIILQKHHFKNHLIYLKISVYCTLSLSSNS